MYKPSSHEEAILLKLHFDHEEYLSQEPLARKEYDSLLTNNSSEDVLEFAYNHWLQHGDRKNFFLIVDNEDFSKRLIKSFLIPPFLI